MALTYTKYWGTSTTADGGEVTVSSISVATGDVVVALWANAGYSAGNTLTISDTGGLLGIWTNRATVAATSTCYAGAWYAVATGSGTISVTVASDRAVLLPGSLAVLVHSGAHATDPVPSAKVYSGSNATDVGQSITPSASGSALWMICGDWAQTNSYAARTDCTIDNSHDVTLQYTTALIRPTTQPRTDANAFTIGETDTSGNITWIALEVQAAAGASGQFARPTSDNTDGAWTPSTGTDLYTCIDEATASDADYISSTSNSTCKVNLGALSTPDTGTQTLRIRTAGSAAKKLVAKLLEGSTARATITVDPLPAAVTQYTASATGITSYADLDLEIEVADATTAPSPTVSFGAIGTGANGGTSVAPSYPTGITAGDLLVCVVTSGATNSETPGTPSGWTSQGSYASTDGTYGVDTGPRRVTVFTKTATGSESGTLTVDITNGGTCRGTISRFSLGHPGYTWNIAATGGNDSTSGTGFSVTGGSISWAPGDVAVVSVGQRVDTVTQSSQSLTASGITFGTLTNRASSAVTTGNDHRHVVDTFAAVTSGTASAAPTWAYTGSAACSGGCHILRLREVPPTEFARVTWAEFETPAAGSGAAALAGAAAAVAVGSGALTTQIRLAGAAGAVAGASAALTAQIALAGIAASVARADGTITAQIRLQGTALAEAIGLAGLTAAIRLQGDAQAQAGASGALGVPITLAGAAQAIAAASGALGTGIQITGAAGAQAGASGALGTGIRFTGAAAAQAQAAANLTTALKLVGAAAAQALADGTLTTAVRLQGQASAQAQASAALSSSIRLVGAAVAQAAASGALDSGAAALGGQAQARAAASAALTTGITLAGAAIAQASASGALNANVAALVGQAVAQALASGALTTQMRLAGQAGAQAQAQAALSTAIQLAGAAIAQAQASGAVVGLAQLYGAAAALALASGQLSVQITLSGAALAQAGAAGALTVDLQLSGAAVAQAIASGALTLEARLSGAALAQGAASGALLTGIPLAGASVASATATGTFWARQSAQGGQLLRARQRVERLEIRRRRVLIAAQPRVLLWRARRGLDV